MGGHGGHPGHSHDDDDEDDEDNDGDDRGESWFAGGERRYENCCYIVPLVPTDLFCSFTLCSGISVQNPDRPGRAVPGGNLVRDLLRRAAE